MVNGALKLKKYVILGRETVIHDSEDSNRDVRKLITEVYVLKPLDKEFDQWGQSIKPKRVWWDFEKIMYNEITTPSEREQGNIGRGRDVGMESGQIFVSTDGTAQDFIDLNFGNTALETNNIRFIKTYSNQNFMKRDRSTTFHEEYDIGVDDAGNSYMKRVDKNAPKQNAQIKADFASIVPGTKFLYHRYDLDGNDVIAVCEVNYWLKNDNISDNPPKNLTDDLDKLDSTNVAMVNARYQAYDMDAFESALQASPDWNEDVNFSKLFA